MRINIGGYNYVEEENILDIKETYKTDETSLTLPIGETHLVLRLDDTTAGLFKYNEKFSIFGDNSKSTYYVREVKPLRQSVYSVYGVSSVGILAERNFAGKMFVNKTEFREVIRTIVGDDFPFYFTDESSAFELRGWIGHCSQREAVRHACISAGVTAFEYAGALYFRRALGTVFQSMHLYQPNETFDDFVITEGIHYSKYACDVYTFSTVATEATVNNVVTDPATKTKYYYSVEKVSHDNTDYPAALPSNELYVQGEMLITSYTDAGNLLDNLDSFYKGGITLEFRCLDKSPKVNGVGFYDFEKARFGFPAQTDVFYGKKNVIKYVCNTAFSEEAKAILLNYKNQSGDLLATREVYKSAEIGTKNDMLTVTHPLITVEVDNRHRVVYTSVEAETLIDESAETVESVDVPCEIALIQDGNVVEIRAADKAYQIDNSVYIGGYDA